MQATETSQDEQSDEQNLKEVEEITFESINEIFDQSAGSQDVLDSRVIGDGLYEIKLTASVPVSSALLSAHLRKYDYELRSLLVSSADQRVLTVTDE